MSSKYLDLFNSNEWKEFYNYCNVGIFKQIDFFRYEDVHTNYLASLFKKDNLFELDTKPLELLLELLKSKEDNKTKYKLKDIDFRNITFANSDKQVNVDGGRLDLLIEFIISGKKYNIILENKLLSSERENQTKKYQNYFEKKNNDIEYIYVFLSLENSPKLSSDDSEYGEYIKISYQELIDNVLEKLDKGDKAPISIDEYLKGFTYLCEYDLMPITSKLKSLVNNIEKKYSNELNEIIDFYKIDDDLEYKYEFRVLYTVLSKNNIFINNKLFNKVGRFKKEYHIHQQTQMVLDILKDLFKHNKITDLNDIEPYNSGWTVIVNEDDYYKMGSRQENYSKFGDIKFKNKYLYYSCPVSREELKGFVAFVRKKYGYSDKDIELYY